MPMDYLWAPWRLSYVAAAKPPEADDLCFICQGLVENDDRRNLVVLRTPRTAVVLNRFPYNNGHLLIAPSAHKGGLEELARDELLEIMQTTQRMVRLICVTSSVCVSRVRWWSLVWETSTWVLYISRRKAVEWMMRSRSR